MNPGYVYILINQSFPTLIKIGRTLRDSRARARELSTTGLPTPFQVAFEIFSEYHKELEAAMHDALRDFRVGDRREFFRYPLDKAIVQLQALNRAPTEPAAQFVAEDITERLRTKYPKQLRPEVVAVRIVQVPGRVWLEITEEEELAGYLKNQLVRRDDLAFIADTNEPLFRPQDDVQVNARKFVNEFDDYSISMVTELFHDDARGAIIRRHNLRRPPDGRR
jgi:hypothetical protein